MPSPIQHRIDPAESVKTRPNRQSPIAATTSAAAESSPAATMPSLDSVDGGEPDAVENSIPESWLKLHSADLIEKLQQWESDLAARESQLNARTAQQDHAERMFRLRAQDAEARQAEQERATISLKQNLAAQARRLAFESHS